MSTQIFNPGLTAFASYFAASLVLLLVFIAIYVRVTPYKEMNLIREGNTAAAASLSGAILGYCLALASSISHSVSLLDMLTWGAIALVVQLLAFFIARIMLPGLIHDVPQNKLASGIFLGVLSLGMGILNAACQTY
ncbi:MAG: DUF350 domain-containing protein [Undibacterium sp.]|nr:DUF350 domain-containing protein [Undibacterium sp.]